MWIVGHFHAVGSWYLVITTIDLVGNIFSNIVDYVHHVTWQKSQSVHKHLNNGKTSGCGDNFECRSKIHTWVYTRELDKLHPILNQITFFIANAKLISFYSNCCSHLHRWLFFAESRNTVDKCMESAHWIRKMHQMQVIHWITFSEICAEFVTINEARSMLDGFLSWERLSSAQNTNRVIYIN